MKRPILKDNIVINVVEIDDDTIIVSKAEHKEMCASEEAKYLADAAAWRDVFKERKAEIDRASETHGMAKMTLSAAKVKAAADDNDAKAALALKQILALEDEVAVREKAVVELQSKPLPEKPQLIRAKRWFYPDGVTVGAPGGNIGERWNGKEYVRPEPSKTSSKEIEAVTEKAI